MGVCGCYGWIGLGAILVVQLNLCDCQCLLKIINVHILKWRACIAVVYRYFLFFNLYIFSYLTELKNAAF